MFKRVHVRRLILHTDRPFKGDGSDVRLAITGAFPNNSVLHNHVENGYLYRIPLIRFLLHHGLPQLVAVGDGVPLLESLKNQLTTLRIFNRVYKVTGWDMHDRLADYGISESELRYDLLSPWLALNEINYQKYTRSGSVDKRKKLLENILVGNIISMSKGFMYSVPNRISARIVFLKEVEVSLKGTPFLGFLGEFSVNFEIPDYWGIGKSISRGFGTVVRMN